jgi:hypothetical protein
MVTIKKLCGAVFLFFAFIAGAGTVFAQETERTDWLSRWRPENRWYMGIYAGYARNTLYMGGAETLEYLKTYEPGNGWTIGLPARYRIFTWLAVQAEPTFITRNYTVRQNGALGEKLNIYDDHTNSFVDFPLMVHFELPVMESAFSLFANTGAYLGVWAASRRQGREVILPGKLEYAAADYDEYYEFDGRYDNRFNAGLLLGLGVQYNFKPVSVFLEWRYNYGLTDLHKQIQLNQIPYMNDTWTINTGVMFNANIFDVFRRGNK